MKKKNINMMHIIIAVGLIIIALFAALFFIKGYQTIKQNIFSENDDELNITIEH